jgi:uncharacterized phage protein (TIGR02220 family)
MECCPKCGHSLNGDKVNPETYQQIISYLNQKTKKTFRPGSQATRRLIRARLNEGFSVPDFFKAIDNQCRCWLSDPQMVQYLRPQTLFSTKFEAYLNNGVKAHRPQSQYKQFERVMAL